MGRILDWGWPGNPIGPGGEVVPPLPACPVDPGKWINQVPPGELGCLLYGDVNQPGIVFTWIGGGGGALLAWYQIDKATNLLEYAEAPGLVPQAVVLTDSEETECLALFVCPGA